MKDTDDTEGSQKKTRKGNILRTKAQKLTETGKSTVKFGLDKGKKIKKKIEETTSEVISEIDSKAKKVKNEVQHEITKAAVEGIQMSKSSTSSSNRLGKSFGGQFENQIFSWYGWMWSVIAFVFVILISFTISSTDSRFSLLPIVLLIAFPFYVFWVIYNAIPEIKVGDKTIFSRKDVSISKQLSFGKAIARTFSREMIKNSPEGTIVIGLFLLLLLYLIVSPFL